MKIEISREINPFGGVNFVFEELKKLGLPDLMNNHLPTLAVQSRYQWKDIISALFSIYYCGGECIEDIGGNLKHHLSNVPYFKIPSPDRILDRLKELTIEPQVGRTKRGELDYKICVNDTLADINMKILSKIGAFDSSALTIDYDNTIIYNKKSDSKKTYKRKKGYQPGIAFLNVNHFLYLENRNGNCTAASFQQDTLLRLFMLLEKHESKRITNFRADSASYQFDVINLVEKYVDNFYISVRYSYFQKYIKDVSQWQEATDNQGDKIFIGETKYMPFKNQAKKADEKEKLCDRRLIIRKKARQDGQLDAFTGEPYEYFGILTNDEEKEKLEVFHFYNQRGAAERQFDILKNDFGWNNMPFSNLEQNTVFLFLMGICKNLYNYIIESFSKRYEGLNSTYRLKKFIFRFITIPAKWVTRSRQNILKVYGKIAFKV